MSIIQGLTSLKFRGLCKNVSSTLLSITQFGLNNRKKSKGRLNLKAILFTEDTKPTTLTMAAGCDFSINQMLQTLVDLKIDVVEIGLLKRHVYTECANFYEAIL